MLVNVSEENFKQEILENKKPVLIDFWADWCGPCKALSPILEKIEHEDPERFLLAKINTEANAALASKFQIRSIPDVRLFIGGTQKDSFVGALPENQIRQFLDKHIPPAGVIKAEKLYEEGKIEESLTILLNGNFIGERTDEILWNISLKQLQSDRIEFSELCLQRIIKNAGKYLPKAQIILEYLRRNNSDLKKIRLLGEIQNSQKAESILNEMILKISELKGEERESVRNQLLVFFEILGNSDPLTLEYRKKLSRALY